MAYSQGGIIDDADYNTLAWGTAAGGTYTTSPANLAAVWGVGTGRYGYGASTSSFTQVTAGSTVTAAQWTGMIQSVNNALAHQGGTAITPTSVTAGNLITYYNSIQTGVTNAFTAAGTGNVVSTTDGSATNTQFTSAWGGSGNRRLLFTQTVTFASGNAARYFFNAGGKVKLTFSRSGGSSHPRNTEWTDLCTRMGTITFGYQNTTGSGTGYTTILNSTNGGYWNLTGTGVSHAKMYADTAPYTVNFIDLQVKWSGTAENGGSPVLTFEGYWENDQVSTFQQDVDGTATQSLVLSTPTTTHIGSATWGTPSVGGSVVAS
jgi:hypothetical protein